MITLVVTGNLHFYSFDESHLYRTVGSEKLPCAPFLDLNLGDQVGVKPPLFVEHCSLPSNRIPRSPWSQGQFETVGIERRGKVETRMSPLE